MLTITAAAAALAITDYLARNLKENKSIANLLADFTDASVAWIRPVFLKEDGTEKKIVKDLTENPDDTKLHDKVKTLIEDRAEDDDKALQLLTDMVAKIVEKTGQPLISNQNTSTITGNQNTVIQGVQNSNINIGNTHQTHHGSGDIIAGDQITNTHYYGNQPINPANGGVWKAMLTAGKIKEAIEHLLSEYANDADKNNTLLLLLGQYNFNNSNFNKGVITDSAANVTRNKIVKSLLEMFG